MVYACAPASGVLGQSGYPAAVAPENPVFLTAPPAASYLPCRSSVCGFVLFFIILGILWFFWNPRGPVAEIVVEEKRPFQGYGSAVGPDQPAPSTTAAQTRPYNQPAGQLAQATGPAPTNQGCANPQAPMDVEATNGMQYGPDNMQLAASIPSRPQAPQVTAPLAGSTSSTGGAPLDASTYGLSEESSEYYKHFKPISLESTMPSGWRSSNDPSKCSAGVDETYKEFSRYAISPNQMKRAENMRSVLRLGESSRDGLSRTLGQRSLLRDFVTPLGPSPIGDNAMLWNDSSVRQNYIAAATGRFPEVAQNC